MYCNSLDGNAVHFPFPCGWNSRRYGKFSEESREDEEWGDPTLKPGFYREGRNRLAASAFLSFYPTATLTWVSFIIFSSFPLEAALGVGEFWQPRITRTPAHRSFIAFSQTSSFSSPPCSPTSLPEKPLLLHSKVTFLGHAVRVRPSPSFKTSLTLLADQERI